MTTLPLHTQRPQFGLVIVGDEILSGKRQDKHMPKVIELLSARGLPLAWARYVGDDRPALTQVLRDAMAGHDVVLSCGGIGATPDDHTRQCAAAALDQPLALHPLARDLIEQRMQDTAAEKGETYDPSRADNQHRFNMGVFPLGAHLIPNAYNKIPGFSCVGPHGSHGHFVPGFPVMAWPMLAWVLDTYYTPYFQVGQRSERSVIVLGAMEASLTPLMEHIEAQHPGVKVFSLPSVDHPQHGRHIELGVKGPEAETGPAYADLLRGLHDQQVVLGPEMVR